MAEFGKLLIGEPGCKLATELDPWVVDKGYTVRAVENIKDVFLTLQCEKINVLVMDVCLPEEIGCEAISIIKSMYRNLPIIVTTDENNPELESSIRQMGIFYYHVKSFGMDELILAISNAMARSARQE
ncbi:MAG: response regulator [Deltaproteobacteria bacterium]|nr:response regulator [Deltaproteobacteria bacterium]